MELKNDFKVDLPVDQAWQELMDIPQVAACVPGAELTESLPDNAYKGKMKLKLGPVALNFQGTVQITDRDDTAKTALLIGKGADAKGRGNASSKTQVRVVPSGNGSEVHLDTTLQLSGMIAQYGRASGVIKAVSDELISQFTQNLQVRLESKDSTIVAMAPAADGSPAPVAAAPAAAAPAPVASSIGAGFIFQAFLRWIKGFFGRKEGA